MRFAGTFRYRKGQLILTVPKDVARVIAQTKGHYHASDLHGIAVFVEVEL